MSRFKAMLINVQVGDLVEVRDTRHGYSVIVLGGDSLPLAETVAQALNAVKPVWFANTHDGKVYIDVRADWLADACVMSLQEVSEMRRPIDLLASCVAQLEGRIYGKIARYVSGA